MSHHLRKNLAQINFSLLLQFASNPETKGLVAPALREELEKVDIPKSIIKSASFVIPTQPINALNDQENTLEKLFDWYLSPQGGQAWTKKQSPLPKTLNMADEEEEGPAETQRAKNGLSFMTKFLIRANKLTERARNRYEKAKQRWQDAINDKTVGTKHVTMAYRQMIDDARNLSTSAEFLALVSLHYQRFLNEVEAAGFDVSAYRKNTKAILDGDPQKYNMEEKDTTLSFFSIPPEIMNDYEKFYDFCNHLYCVANDEKLQSNYTNTGKPLYPLYAHNIYRRMQAHPPEWVKKYIDELATKALQATDFSSDTAAWIVGFRDSPDKNDKGGRARSPERWKDEIKRISVREEVLWREQETRGSRTQIFREVARDYGCSEENVRDWFYGKTEKKSAARKRDREKK